MKFIYNLHILRGTYAESLYKFYVDINGKIPKCNIMIASLNINFRIIKHTDPVNIIRVKLLWFRPRQCNFGQSQIRIKERARLLYSILLSSIANMEKILRHCPSGIQISASSNSIKHSWKYIYSLFTKVIKLFFICYPSSLRRIYFQS